MAWFSILKISTKDAIADAKRFAPEEVEEGKQEKMNAYARMYRTLGRPPTKLEVREEIINPVERHTSFGQKPWNKGLKVSDYKNHSPTSKVKFNREYREHIKQRPKKYDLVANVVDFLNRQGKPIDRANIIDEMGLTEGNVTPDDNEAIDLFLEQEREQ